MDNTFDATPRHGGSRDDGICYLDYTIDELVALFQRIAEKRHPKFKNNTDIN